MMFHAPKDEAVRLLDRRHLVVTGPLDKARWNYTPVLSLLQRARFRLVIRLLGDQRFRDTLEIGYGSGVFLVELRHHSERLFGVDIHRHGGEVVRQLADVGVHAALLSASAERIPFASASMDLIVSVSTLEYVADQRRAAAEMRRVLRPAGRLAVVYPLQQVVSDFALRMLTGESATQYGEGRLTLVPALGEHFSFVQRLRFPPWLPRPLQVYEAALLAPRQEAAGAAS